MSYKFLKTICVCISVLFLGCKQDSIPQLTIVYQTENLIVTKVSEHIYEHTSFLNTEKFGKVSCNGMVVTNQQEAVVFDTPVDNKGTSELIEWISKDLRSKIKAVIPTHFHEDCLGGLNVFKHKKIPSYAFTKTVTLARGKYNYIPKNTFADSLSIPIGNKKVYAGYFGEGHTQDNIIGYFPAENTMFGGCLIKELNASKGNLEDANVKEWSSTVSKIKKTYPEVKLIIPGHGKIGNESLLDYTINLFKTSLE